MTTSTICIEPGLPILAEIEYTLKIFSINKRINLIFSPSGLRIGVSNESNIKLSKNFVSNFTQQKFSFIDNLAQSGFIEHPDGTPDYLSTAFYMLACLQEYDQTSNLDSLKRFKFSNSYQWHFKNAEQNIVQFCFDKLAETLAIRPIDEPTRFFLSHDIDSVYGSLLQDGFYAFKRGRLDILLKLIFNVALNKPDWLNIDQIINIESEYDFRSTFFWIVRKGKEQGLINADYRFKSSTIQNNLKQVANRGFENGLHKSVSAATFEEELAAFTNKPVSNRYHYLKFNLPEGFNALEDSGLKMDASLGFAETMGFRNSYGLPCNPFNIKERRPYSFVEVPLHVMDRTFFQYNPLTPVKAKQTIIDFLEKNRKNCVLSILWHNNFFTNYKFNGYLGMYKGILTYIRENNFNTITQEELIKNYSIH